MAVSMADLRRSKKITQEDLAKEVGLTKGAIGMYETGKRTPSLKTAKVIANYFEVSLEEISFANNK